MGKYLQFLNETGLFFGLTRTQTELIESIVEDQVFQKGEIVFAENSHQSELYLILEGVVEILVNPKLVSPNASSADSLEWIATLTRGQCFGEIALVDQGIRSATARAAKNNTRLLRIDRSRLLTLCESYPDLGYRVMKNLAMELGEKIRNANLRVREEMLYHKGQQPAS